MQWSTNLFQAIRETGPEPHPGSKLEGWVRGAGFQKVHCEKFQIPIGPWAKSKRLKDLGMFNLAQLLDGLEGFSLRPLCQQRGFDRDEVLELLDNVRAEMTDRRIHGQFDL